MQSLLFERQTTPLRTILSVQIFLSHTKLDKDFCDRFDIVAARVGLKFFRSELESIQTPAWATIKEELEKSAALFLLVGKELVSAQASSDSAKREEWKFTQNWISCEIGMACQRQIDVWVICDNVEINFPVPYLNNYEVNSIHLEDKTQLGWWKDILEQYKTGKTFEMVDPKKIFKCLNCGASFNLMSKLGAGARLICPTCLFVTIFPKGT
jgi:DNA-directed RNA polymerase subunit RPC12/RpoP